MKEIKNSKVTFISGKDIYVPKYQVEMIINRLVNEDYTPLILTEQDGTNPKYINIKHISLIN